MGILKSLLRNAITDGISNGVSKALGNVVEKEVTKKTEKELNEIADNLNEAAQTTSASEGNKEAIEKLKQAVDNYTAYVKGMSEEAIAAAAKILTVLREQFPQYIVRTNVSPTTLGGKGSFLNYNFGVYEGDTPKLFIMLVGRNTCATRLYRWSKEEAQKNGVTMINFVEHYPNEVEYIKERLQQYL